ncbi:MAG: DUF5655 domain-containing protein [Pseudomonadota bacterium]
MGTRQGTVKIILDTVESLVHRLLVLPSLAEQLEDAVPSRGGNKKIAAVTKSVTTTKQKISAAPQKLRKTYDLVADALVGLGDDVTVHPQKHYIAFRRSRNFASVQIYNQKRIIRVYLNIDPDTVDIDASFMRDVRQIGHFGTGDLEITIAADEDVSKFHDLFQTSYSAS